MAHRRQTIIDAAVSEMISRSIAGGNVWHDSTYRLDSLPAVRVIQAEDVLANTQSIPHVHRDLEIQVELFADAATNIDSVLNQLDADCYAMMMTHTWRPDGVDDVRQVSTSTIDNVDGAEKPTAGMVSIYTIRYRHNETDAEAFT